MKKFDQLLLAIALVAMVLNAVAFGLPQVFVEYFGPGGVATLVLGLLLWAGKRAAAAPARPMAIRVAR